MDFEKIFMEYDSLLEKRWSEILSSSKLVKLVMNGCSDRDLFATYLIETFHYTAHNAKNQAMVVSNLKTSSSKNIRYMKFCLKHALEEAGHELMALHDLNTLGKEYAEEDLREPLPKTKALVDHIYDVSMNGNPYQRLGYSYWAESSYKYFDQVLKTMAKNMQLKPSMMTFFVAHSDIDEDHFVDIKNIIKLVATTTDDVESIKKVMLSTLDATALMLDDVYEEYMSNK